MEGKGDEIKEAWTDKRVKEEGGGEDKEWGEGNKSELEGK